MTMAENAFTLGLRTRVYVNAYLDLEVIAASYFKVYTNFSTRVYVNYPLNPYLNMLVILELYFVVHGGWGEWTGDSFCSVSCGGGKTSRTRKCDKPKPKNGGNQCNGQSVEVKICADYSCEG